MATISTNEFKAGVKIIVDAQPYTIISNEFVKPGKGQAFNRVKLKNLLTSRVIERTFKSGDKVDVADVVESQLRLLYIDGDEVVFMDDHSFEQSHIKVDAVSGENKWLKEDEVYTVILYNGTPVTVEPPTFLQLKIVETAPGDKGNTASGRVLKPAIVETGAEIQVPIFVEEGEIIKVDTRTGEYDSRVTK